MIDPKLYELIKEANRLLGNKGTLIIHNSEWLEYSGDKSPRDFSTPDDFAQWVQSIGGPEAERKAEIREAIKQELPHTDITELEKLVTRIYELDRK